MTRVATTRMSAKGEVVIPQKIRRELGLKSGSELVVIGSRDGVLLKPISPTSVDEFDRLAASARARARRSGLTRKAIRTAITEARRRR